MAVDRIPRRLIAAGVARWWRVPLLVLVSASLTLLPTLAEASLHQTWIDGVFDDASPIDTPAVWFESPGLQCPSVCFHSPAVFVIGSVPPGPESRASAPAREASRTRAPPLS